MGGAEPMRFLLDYLMMASLRGSYTPTNHLDYLPYLKKIFKYLTQISITYRAKPEG